MLLLFTHYVDSFETPWTVAHQAPLSMGFSNPPANADDVGSRAFQVARW